MIVTKDISTFSKGPSAATIGFFDGLHLGHRFLLDQVKENAQIRDISSLAITFRRHPLEVVRDGFSAKCLSTLEEKLSLLEQTGIDHTVVLDFDKSMSAMSAHDFMKDVLKKKLGVSCLVIGHDHRFGHDRSDGFEDYVRYGKELGMEVIQARKFDSYGILPSSSYVRNSLIEGNVSDAARALGYYYPLRGIVVSGHQVGRKIGFPTANISIEDKSKILPKRGVYAVWANISGKRFRGMLNIGHRPTLHDDGTLSLEVNVLDFSGDIYGETVILEFVERLRDEMEFSSVEALALQLEKDRDSIVKILK